MAEARQLIVGELMQMEGPRAAANYDWQTIKTSIKNDGDLSATCAAGRWGVQVLVPQGLWTQGLLTGVIALTAGAYAVPLPHSTYVEVTLDSRTTRILKLLVTPRAHARIDTDMSKYCVIFKLGRRGGPRTGPALARPGASAKLPPRRTDSPAHYTAACSAILRIVLTHDGLSSISDSSALLND
jgi:hypothetical protein